jgi:hypothetical protein
MDRALGAVLALVVSGAVFADTDWPEEAVSGLRVGCVGQGAAGKDASSEQIKAANAFCECYANTMASNIPYADMVKIAKKGEQAGAEMDLTPAGNRLKAALEVKCGDLSKKLAEAK